MFYLFNLLLIPIYYTLISGLRKKNRDTYFFLFLGIHVILLRALANPFNYVDTDGYAYAYSSIAEMSLAEAMSSQYMLWGIGYVFINWVLSRISEDPMLLFIFISIITVGGVVWFYKKTSYSPLSTALIYVLYPMLYLQSFGVIRQHLSIAIVLFALYYIDKIKVSIPLAIVAILIHTSSIVLLPFYLWKVFKLEKWNIIPLTVVLVTGFIVLRLSMEYVLSFLERYQSEGFGEEGNNNIMPIVVLGLTTLVFLISRGKNKLLQNESTIFSFIIYGFMISLFGLGLHGAGRLSLMFIYVIPVAVTYLKKYSKSKAVYIMYFGAILFLIGFYIVNSYDPLKYEYVPLWENVKNYK